MANGRVRQYQTKVVPPVWLYESRIYDVTIGATPTLIIPANPFRVSFLMVASTNLNVFVWPVLADHLSQGYSLASNGGSFERKFADHPASVGLAWWGNESFGNALVRVIEELAVR